MWPITNSIRIFIGIVLLTPSLIHAQRHDPVPLERHLGKNESVEFTGTLVLFNGFPPNLRFITDSNKVVGIADNHLPTAIKDSLEKTDRLQGHFLLKYVGKTEVPYYTRPLLMFRIIKVIGGVLSKEIIGTQRSGRDSIQQDAIMIKECKALVRKYWKSSLEDNYELLSKHYKEILRESHNISNAHEYESTFGWGERVWSNQTYQSAKVMSPTFVQITVLSAWEEDGYEGVRTFVFDLEKEDGRWKIEHIMD